MNKRRDFIKKSILGGIGASSLVSSKKITDNRFNTPSNSPLIISTWNHGLDANLTAWKELNKGKSGIEAVESGVKISEADPKVRSVGYGGYPDRDGMVTLDACIMDKNSNCGAVSFLQNIKHPISVAKLVSYLLIIVGIAILSATIIYFLTAPINWLSYVGIIVGGLMLNIGAAAIFLIKKLKLDIKSSH